MGVSSIGTFGPVDLQNINTHKTLQTPQTCFGTLSLPNIKFKKFKCFFIDIILWCKLYMKYFQNKNG